MRIRVTFLAGFAAGFVVGTRAGRERYEQLVKLGRKAVENPNVQQATRAAAGLPPRTRRRRRKTLTDLATAGTPP